MGDNDGTLAATRPLSAIERRENGGVRVEVDETRSFRKMFVDATAAAGGGRNFGDHRHLYSVTKKVCVDSYLT